MTQRRKEFPPDYGAITIAEAMAKAVNMSEIVKSVDRIATSVGSDVIAALSSPLIYPTTNPVPTIEPVASELDAQTLLAENASLTAENEELRDENRELRTACIAQRSLTNYVETITEVFTYGRRVTRR